MSRDLRICFIGDSYINGTRDETFLGWTGRVCASRRHSGIDLTSYSLGIRRNTSTDIRARWQAEARLRLPPTCEGRLVFSFGVNDCFLEADRLRVPIADSMANAQHILTTASAWLPTLVVGPPPVASVPGQGAINQRIATYSAALRRLCAERQVPFIDVCTPLRDDPLWTADLDGDGAHPTSLGYERLAQVILSNPAWQAWMAASPTP